MAHVFEKLTGGPLGVNAYIVSAPGRDDCIVIDPGVPFPQLEEALRGRRVPLVLLTHAHFDHMLTLGPLREAGAALCLHRLDAPMLADERLNLCGMVGKRLRFAPAERLCEDGDTIEAAGVCLRVLHTPGHTPGGICLLAGDDLFSGDTMFWDSYGRTDFPGGSAQQMQDSLKRLWRLPAGVVVHPGHGPDTTIGQERRADD